MIKSHRLFKVFFIAIVCCFVARATYAQETVVDPGTAVPVENATISPDSGNVSLDFKDADINNVLRILSLKSNVNIVAGPEVQGTVTIRLEDVPWERALDVVLRTYGYVYEREGNIIRVTTKENLTTEELVTETFILNYTTASEAEEAIRDILSERGRIKSVPRTNMLVVTDIPTNIYKIREVVNKLDKSTPQAYIDSKIVKTQLQEGENLGINWDVAGNIVGGTRQLRFPFGKHDAADFLTDLGETGEDYKFSTLTEASLVGVLDFLKTRNNTKIISNPRITVLNNQTAKIKVGTDVPVPTLERNETTGSFEISGFDYRETGVVLEVTPHINDANEIMVELKPEVSSQGAEVDFSSGGSSSFDQFPSFDVESAETQVLIKSGETIAIGGLMSDKSDITITKVPVLGDLPLFGKAFRSKRQTEDDTNRKMETLFFVTVTIVDTEGQPALSPGRVPPPDEEETA